MYLSPHRTQDTERRTDRTMVCQREAVPGILCYEERRPKLVILHFNKVLREDCCKKQYKCSSTELVQYLCLAKHLFAFL